MVELVKLVEFSGLTQTTTCQQLMFDA